VQVSRPTWLPAPPPVPSVSLVSMAVRCSDSQLLHCNLLTPAVTCGKHALHALHVSGSQSLPGSQATHILCGICRYRVHRAPCRLHHLLALRRWACRHRNNVHCLVSIAWLRCVAADPKLLQSAISADDCVFPLVGPPCHCSPVLPGQGWPGGCMPCRQLLLLQRGVVLPGCGPVSHLTAV
jgi:hypothetical protein